MDKRKLEKLLKNMDADTKVPKGLAAKISANVHAHGKKLERNKIIWATVKMSVAMLVLVYGLAATVLSSMGSRLALLISAFANDPSLLLSSNGFGALVERLPIISGVLLLAGLIYVLQHVAIKSLKKSPFVFATTVTSLALFVVIGSFVSGIVIGADNDNEVQQLASNTIFNPVVTSASERDYSFYGTIKNVQRMKEAGVTVFVVNTDGGDKTVSVDITKVKMVVEDSGDLPGVGDNIFVVGEPAKNGLKATFLRVY